MLGIARWLNALSIWLALGVVTRSTRRWRDALDRGASQNTIIARHREMTTAAEAAKNLIAWDGTSRPTTKGQDTP